MRSLAGCNAPCWRLSRQPANMREIYIIRRAAHRFYYEVSHQSFHTGGIKKCQEQRFWYRKHESRPECFHRDVTEDCKQMRRIWCLDQQTDTALQVPPAVLVFVLSSLTSKNIIETLKSGKFWPENIFFQPCRSCFLPLQSPGANGKFMPRQYFMLSVTIQFL